MTTLTQTTMIRSLNKAAVSSNPELLRIMAEAKAKVAAVKQATDEAAVIKTLTSEAVIEAQAQAELAAEFTASMEQLYLELQALKKSTAAQAGEDYKFIPKYSLGKVGHIYPVLNTWVYLPDVVKTISGLTIPSTAFTPDDLHVWGNNTYCRLVPDANGLVTPVIVDSIRPDFAAVKAQIELLSAYLGLGFVPELVSEAQWEASEVRAKVKAERDKSLYLLMNQQAIDSRDDNSTNGSKHFIV